MEPVKTENIKKVNIVKSEEKQLELEEYFCFQGAFYRYNNKNYKYVLFLLFCIKYVFI